MWRAFEVARWDGDPAACPRCGARGRCSLLPTRDASTARRVWRCAACRGQFSVLYGTLLAGSRVPLPVWPALVGELAAGGVSSRELARRHGVTPETVRLVRARLAAAGVSGGGNADAFASLLRLPPGEVARVVRAVPARRTPRQGPSADYR